MAVEPVVDFLSILLPSWGQDTTASPHRPEISAGESRLPVSAGHSALNIDRHLKKRRLFTSCWGMECEYGAPPPFSELNLEREIATPRQKMAKQRARRIPAVSGVQSGLSAVQSEEPKGEPPTTSTLDPVMDVPCRLRHTPQGPQGPIVVAVLLNRQRQPCVIRAKLGSSDLGGKHQNRRRLEYYGERHGPSSG